MMCYTDTIYVIELETPLLQYRPSLERAIEVRYYMGSSSDVPGRLTYHATASNVGMIKEARRRGYGFTLVALLDGGRNEEAAWKRQHNLTPLVRRWKADPAIRERVIDALLDGAVHGVSQYRYDLIRKLHDPLWHNLAGGAIKQWLKTPIADRDPVEPMWYEAAWQSLVESHGPVTAANPADLYQTNEVYLSLRSILLKQLGGVR